MPIEQSNTSTPRNDSIPKMDTEVEQMIIAATVTGPSRFRSFAIMSGLCSAMFVSALNQTTVATAIPSICRGLNSASGYEWISAAYLLSNSITGPIWSKLSDIWGRKAILLTAVTLYFVFSIICATSQSMQMLIVGRALQGVAGGGLIQIVYATISDIFSMRSRTFYLGMLQVVWATAGGIGPIAGGTLAQYVSWRWIFWINLPITGVSFLILLVFLDVHNPKTKLLPGLKAVDWYGCLSMLSFMVMLSLGLNFGGTTFSWNSPAVICLVVAGIVMFPLFLVSEKKAPHPLVPLRVFRIPSNIAALLIGFMHDWAVFSTEFYLPLYFQSVKNASPMKSGIFLIPITFTQALVGIMTGIIVYKTGRYVDVLRVGVTLLAIGNGLYINLDATSPLGKILTFEVIAAIGAGLLFQPPLISLQAHVHPKETAAATATLGLVRNLATSLSIVVGGVVFSNRMNKQSHSLLESGLSKNLTDIFSGSSAAAHVTLVSTISDAKLQFAVKNAFAESLRGVWIGLIRSSKPYYQVRNGPQLYGCCRQAGQYLEPERLTIFG
ncbi:putative MFS transporter [Mollisia scopiformis]|uniref:Putative MFS transporter n=1 Tax=Mollisia scopiformis TaxID=149040 RepID=A0A194XR62_MOLSC|nr:putative MFS transporter [Mollisia scopiformis]KUJ22678.1 putative MFS transporter [Mollisia scopiformis]